MAASLYEPLDEREQRRLARTLDRSERARREFEALQRVVASVPRTRPEPGADLLPRVQARLRATRRVRRAPAHRLAVASAVCAAAVVAFAGLLSVQEMLRADGDATLLATPADRSPAANLLREAAARAEQADFGGAYMILQTIVDRYPSDPLAGTAQLELARLQFDQFANYAEAYRAYRDLRETYPDVFRSRPENADRLDVLAEARRVDYASLEELDAATRRSGGIEALERVIARYPATMTASLAAERMADRIAGADGSAGGGPARLRALEEARDRCTDPVAAARLNIEIAYGYWRDLHDPARARDIGSEALGCANPEVVEMARAFLRELDPAAR